MAREGGRGGRRRRGQGRRQPGGRRGRSPRPKSAIDARRVDPRFAGAHANLSFSHYLDNALAYAHSPQQSIAMAETAAKQAIAIDDKDAMAHFTLGRALTAQGNHPAAIAELRTALELNPSFALAHYGLGVALLYNGRAAEALPEFETAARLSPHDPHMWLFETLVACGHIALGQFEDAEQLGRSAIRRPGVGFWAYSTLASALGSLGRIEEARPVLDKLRELKPDFSPEFFESVWIGVDPSFTAPLFEGLRKAGLDFPDAPAGTGE